MIQIHPKHIGPQATEADARQLVGWLIMNGWEAVYYVGPEPPQWTFTNISDCIDFYQFFERVRSELWPAFTWRIVAACDCGRCEHGNVVDALYREARLVSDLEIVSVNGWCQHEKDIP